MLEKEITREEMIKITQDIQADLDRCYGAISDGKSELKNLRKAISGYNAGVTIIESYHGIDWADEIGTDATQEIAAKLARREAFVVREIGKLKGRIKTLEKSLEKWGVNA